MRVPAAWLVSSLSSAPVSSSSSHLLLAKVPTPLPVHLSGGGISLLPLEALRRSVTSSTTTDVATATTASIDATTAPLLECWTALLSRLLLYLPTTPPSSLPPPSGTSAMKDESGDDKDVDSLNPVFSVDQISALLLPAAPDSHALGGLHPRPPHSPYLRTNLNNTLSFNDRPVSRPTPSLIKSTDSSKAIR